MDEKESRKEKCCSGGKFYIIPSIFAAAGLVLGLVVAYLVFPYFIPEPVESTCELDIQDEELEFADCLTENNAVMYGTEWCSHCKDQKNLFGEDFKKVNYVNCDYDKASCDAAGVEGYPTWVINGASYPGAQSLERLAELTGCELGV